MATNEVFVPSDGASRMETAILLIGTAREAGVDPQSVRTVFNGFYITPEHAAFLDNDGPLDEPEDEPQPLVEPEVPEEDEDEGQDLYDPADYTVAEVKEFVTEHPDLAPDLLASEEEGKSRSTLIEWLTEFSTNASGDRAEKNTGTDKE